MPVKRAFQPDIVTITIAEITPIKPMTAAQRKTDTYRRIAASICKYAPRSTYESGVTFKTPIIFWGDMKEVMSGK